MLAAGVLLTHLLAGFSTRCWLGREMLVQEKNMDIERFRLELDAILDAARELAPSNKNPPPDGRDIAEATVSPNKRLAKPLRALDPNIRYH